MVRQGIYLPSHQSLRKNKRENSGTDPPVRQRSLTGRRVFASAFENMIRLRELHLDTGERNSPPAESPGSNLGDEEPDTTGLVAAVDSEIESANVPVSVTVGITPPRATDDHTPEPTSGSNEATDQETPPHQPGAKSNFSRFLDKVGLTSTTLGFIFAVILGAISWSGLNYANYYAKKSYDLALYQACRTYEVYSSQLRTKRENWIDNVNSVGSSKQYGVPNFSLYRN